MRRKKLRQPTKQKVEDEFENLMLSVINNLEEIATCIDDIKEKYSQYLMLKSLKK